MEMLDSATLEKITTSTAIHQVSQNQKQVPTNKFYKKFQLPQLNLNLNQSMQFDVPPTSLINQS